jgi:hypothetical protein
MTCRHCSNTGSDVAPDGNPPADARTRNAMPSRTPPRWLVAVAVAALGSFPLLALPASANETVNANHIVLISNDIANTTTTVIPNAGSSGGGGSSAPSAVASSSGGSGNGSANNRSGLGDGTNPGQGGSHSNSGNQGTNNPNNAHH